MLPHSKINFPNIASNFHFSQTFSSKWNVERFPLSQNVGRAWALPTLAKKPFKIIIFCYPTNLLKILLSFSFAGSEIFMARKCSIDIPLYHLLIWRLLEVKPHILSPTMRCSRTCTKQRVGGHHMHKRENIYKYQGLRFRIN